MGYIFSHYHHWITLTSQEFILPSLIYSWKN